MKIIPYFLLFALLAQTQLMAQKTSEDYLGSWYTIGLNHRFTEKFSVTPYAELRYYEPSSNYNLIFTSLSGNYHIQSNQTLSIAYAYLDIDSVLGEDNRSNTIENRIYEQYTYKHPLGAFSLQYKINKTVFLSIKDEPFINFQDQAFHENRFFIGGGLQLLKNMQLKIEYLKHHIKKKNLNRIQIGISIKTDSRKKQAEVKQ